jgi:hypothetical protein
LICLDHNDVPQMEKGGDPLTAALFVLPNFQF